MGGAMAGGGRKRRDLDCQQAPEKRQEVVQACYTLLRGFLNAMDAYDNDCSNFFTCEATKEASKLGKIGQVLAKVASSNAHFWLFELNGNSHNRTEEAGLHGCGTEDCQRKYPCSRFHKTYKKPQRILF